MTPAMKRISEEHAHLLDALNERDRELAALVESSSNVVFRLGTDLRFKYISASIEHRLGFSQAQFVGKTIQEIDIAEYDSEGLEKICRKALETRKETQREVAVVGRYYTTRIFPQFAPDGSIAWLLGVSMDVTERKIAEDAQRRSQHHYEALVQTIDGIVWQLDYPSWQFTFVSKQAERILGYPVECWLREPNFWADHLHPEDRHWATDLCHTATKRGEDHQFDYRMIAADGRIVWLRDIVTVEVSDGQTVGLCGLMVDISERKKEESFRSGQHRILEMIATGRPLPEVLESLTLLIEAYSDGMLTSIMLVAEDRLHLVHGAAPSLPPAYFDSVGRAVIGPRAGSCGTSIYRGEPVIVTDVLTDPLWEDFRGFAIACGFRACWSTPIVSHKGDVMGSFAMYYREPRAPTSEDRRMIDIAAHIAGIAIERKLAEDALRHSEERNRATLRAVPDLIFVQNEEGVYLDFHAKNPSDLYLSPEQFIGKNMRDILPAGLVADFMKCFQDAVLSDEPQSIEYELKVDGQVRYFEARIVRAGDGRFLSVVRNITDRKTVEKRLRRGNEQIRKLAGKLITAQEEERRRVSRDLHDDVSQKVAALAIAISMAKRKVAARKGIGADLENLQRRTDQLADDIRHLSHQLHPAVLEHSGIVAALKSFTTEFSRLENLPVKLTLPDRCEIPHDVGICLYRVVQEALRNVAKHSEANRAEVVLSIIDHEINLWIKDDGRGFEVDGARGKGLGMVSIEERIRLCDGSLQVTSQPDHGTTLFARIPLNRSI